MQEKIQWVSKKCKKISPEFKCGTFDREHVVLLKVKLRAQRKCPIQVANEAWLRVVMAPNYGNELPGRNGGNEFFQEVSLSPK